MGLSCGAMSPWFGARGVRTSISAFYRGMYDMSLLYFLFVFFVLVLLGVGLRGVGAVARHWGLHSRSWMSPPLREKVFLGASGFRSRRSLRLFSLLVRVFELLEWVWTSVGLLLGGPTGIWMDINRISRDLTCRVCVLSKPEAYS